MSETPIEPRREALIAEMIDRDMYHNDALYHAQVSMLRRWLTMTERAMRDEGLSDATAYRVLNRMIYGSPETPDTPRHAEAEWLR